jgi:hypothetical protein
MQVGTKRNKPLHVTRSDDSHEAKIVSRCHEPKIQVVAMSQGLAAERVAKHTKGELHKRRSAEP